MTLSNALFGGGVNISNIIINCPSGAIGTFTTSGSCNLGLSSGIVLSSGNITDINQPGSSFASTDFSNFYSDPQLTSIEPSATNDVCIMEFDIQPYCNQLEIKFSFGSEEYPEYVNTGYNDAFGFFITGPLPGIVPLVVITILM